MTLYRTADDPPLTYDDLVEFFTSTGMLPDDARELAEAFDSERLVVFQLPEVDA